jgi:4-hydroxy-tetrahydrodipicolinate synthase
MFGLSVALLTPFSEDGSIDKELAKAHGKWVLENGANSITLFGTTGEGSSLSQRERLALLETLTKSVMSPDQVIASVITPSLEEAISQCREYHAFGVKRILIAPPFFFKDPGFKGVFNWYSQIFSSLNALQMQFILYNIPQLTMVTIEPALISALQEKFGHDMVFGVKDSTGNLAGTLEFIKNKNLMVAVGDERTLADALSHGASGAICGMSNVYPKLLAEIIQTKSHDKKINTITNLIVEAPVTAGIKALLALNNEDNRWLKVRPPLENSTPSHQLRLKNAL